MKKIYIYLADPCWKRSLDANKIQDYLLKNSYSIVKKPEESDTIIIVTCGFLNHKTEYALEKIKEFQKYNAELIVAGCIPDIDKEELSKIFNGKTLTTKELDEKIKQIFPPIKKIEYDEINDANLLYEELGEEGVVGVIEKVFNKISVLEKTYTKFGDYVLKHLLGEHSIGYQFSKEQFHIRISWGCIGNCSYCAINKAVGPLRSKPLDECIQEFRKGLKEGYKDFILDASDVGAYGIDINSSFPEILNEMIKIPGDYKISIRELHPVWLVKYIDKLDDILKSNKILVVDIALQSANKRILKLMHRFSDTKKITDAVIKIEKSNPNLILLIEWIVGFPTETWEEFEETLKFIKELDIAGGQIYQFSCKKDTKAEKIEPKITLEEKHKRINYAKEQLEKQGYYTYFLSNEKILMFSKRK